MRTTNLIVAGAAALTLIAPACSSSGTSSAGTTLVAAVTTTNSAGTTVVAPVTTANPPAGTTVVAPVTTTGGNVDTNPVAPVTTPAGAVDPNAPELVEPGDIPDNQVFVSFASSDGSYSVKVPEGWARTEQNGVVNFTDKYNSIMIQSVPTTTAPTAESVKANGLVDVTSDPTFTLLDVTPVTRKAGDGILATFEIGSAPNEVTGKKALLAVERYVFVNNGAEVVLTLSGAKGADNVDPWRIVSDSLTWK